MKNSERSIKNRGFTLIECVIALGVIMAICLLFIPMLRYTQIMVETEKDNHFMEWHVFLIQLENESQNLYVGDISKTRMYFVTKEGKHVQIVERYGDMIRKRKNGGHQPLLLDVKELTITEKGKKQKIQVVFSNEEVYEAYCHFPRGKKHE